MLLPPETGTVEIAENTVVSIHYTLSEAGGDVIETSQGDAPMTYLHGAGEIIPGLEDALEGRSPGDEFSITIPPEEAYGERDESLVQALPLDEIEHAGSLEVGMQLEAESEDDEVELVTVVAIDDESVTIDANHELAGRTLRFEVSVVDVRPATEAELEHGHAHGPGAHEH